MSNLVKIKHDDYSDMIRLLNVAPLSIFHANHDQFTIVKMYYFRNGEMQ